MKIGSQLSLKQSQALAMTQSLQQSLRLLQLSQIELELEIETQLGSNIMLEIDPSEELSINELSSDAPETGSNKDEDPQTLDLDHTQNMEVELDWERNDDSGETLYSQPSYDEALDPLNQRTEAHEESLHELLLWQLTMSRFTDQDRAIAVIIIDSINSDGYFLMPLTEVVEVITNDYPEVDEDDVHAVLTRIQHFDPPGIAATSLENCLIKQIELLTPRPLWADLAIIILKEAADSLMRLDFKTLQRQFNVDEATLRATLNELRFLNPKPGASIGANNIAAIKPDILVTVEKGQISVSLNSDILPKLRVNREYARLAQTAKTDRAMLREHLTSARFFIRHIEDRFDTLLRVAQKIIAHQKLFFLYGESAMRPLQLKHIAEALEFNESTISRAVSGKYLLCPAGVYELKFFFSNQIESEDEGESASGVAIRAALKAIVEAENREKPHSDAMLATLLEEQGFSIARRTVAKYREVLGILSSTERKRLA